MFFGVTILWFFVCFITKTLFFNFGYRRKFFLIKKNLRKSEEEIKEELLESMVEREVIEHNRLNQVAKNVFKLKDSVTCVK